MIRKIQVTVTAQFLSCLYSISCILQAELFDDLRNAPSGLLVQPELSIETTLPAHLGGPVDKVPQEILDRECQDDPELRREILAGTVPTVDTILRCASNFSISCLLLSD
jgi:hypothetical protein